MSPEELAGFLRNEFPLVDAHPDVAGLFRRPRILAALGPALADPFLSGGVTVVLAPEARGPVLGALVAQQLSCGLMLARKVGRNHPGADQRTSGGVGWRGSAEVFQSRSFDLAPTDNVLLVDDWITTGSSLRALVSIVEEAGADVVGASVIVDKSTGATRDELAVRALVRFADIAGVAGPGR
jgi:adenine phosphoribosyltransferase